MSLWGPGGLTTSAGPTGVVEGATYIGRRVVSSIWIQLHCSFVKESFTDGSMQVLMYCNTGAWIAGTYNHYQGDTDLQPREGPESIGRAFESRHATDAWPCWVAAVWYKQWGHNHYIHHESCGTTVLCEPLNQGFPGLKTLNRVQGKLNLIAFGNNEPILLCAPTGAGKVCLVMHFLRCAVGYLLPIKDEHCYAYYPQWTWQVAWRIHQYVQSRCFQDHLRRSHESPRTTGNGWKL